VVLSIIIPIWNTTPDLQSMTYTNVERMIALTPDAEVILIDNGSPFPVMDYVFKGQSPVYVESWPENRGLAPAWNAGVRKARGTTLCWMNNDVWVLPDWEKPLVEAAQHGYIAFPWTNGEKNDGYGIAGWCFTASRETYQKIGPFDETFVPAFYEDTDWFHRATVLGIELVSCPQSNVQHTRRTTASKLDNMNLLFLANKFRYSWKHEVPTNQAPPFWRPLQEKVYGH
jgi:GT2 family glycosyltransferase